MRRRHDEPQNEAMILGIGLDSDGEKRITRGQDILLVGGTDDTHRHMQEKVIRLTEELERRDMRLRDVRCDDELREIADRAGW